MSLIEQYNLISKIVDHMTIFASWCSYDVLASFFKFLDRCFDCETYTAEKENFVTQSCKQLCWLLADEYLKVTLQSNYLVSDDTKNLTAEINRWKKEVAKKDFTAE